MLSHGCVFNDTITIINLVFLLILSGKELVYSLTEHSKGIIEVEKLSKLMREALQEVVEPPHSVRLGAIIQLPSGQEIFGHQFFGERMHSFSEIALEDKASDFTS